MVFGNIIACLLPDGHRREVLANVDFHEEEEVRELLRAHRLDWEGSVIFLAPPDEDPLECPLSACMKPVAVEGGRLYRQGRK